MEEFNKIIVICGPTATGKSNIAVNAAERINGEIICSDSMQIYSGVNIGTASPDPSDMKKIPHHLYGFVSPDTEYSLYDYQKAAYNTIDNILSRKRIPILCGGTGLYISSLKDGIDLPSAETDKSLRESLEKDYIKDPEGTYNYLKTVDPEAAESVHINNGKRVIRYIELYITTGKTYTERAVLSRKGSNSMRKYDFSIFILEPDKDWLRSSINDRVDKMIDKGLISEALSVYENRAKWKTLAQAIGYKEFFPFFEGIKNLEQCTDDLKTATYHYAKRQVTWFKKYDESVRIPVNGSSSPDSAVETIITSFI